MSNMQEQTEKQAQIIADKITAHINKTTETILRNTTESLVELRVNIFAIRCQISAKHYYDLYLLIRSLIQHRFPKPPHLTGGVDFLFFTV